MNIDSMIQGNPQALVTSYNGVLVADSLVVADQFGKRHADVLRTIDGLITEVATQNCVTNAEPESYFIPSDYQNRGKTYKNIFLPATALVLTFKLSLYGNRLDLLAHKVELFYKGKRWFIGEIKKQKEEHDGTNSITAYDPLFLFGKHEDDYYFKNQTATQIIKSMAKKIGLKVYKLENTNVVISHVLYKKGAPDKITVDVLARTWNSGGDKFWFRYDPVNNGILLKRRTVPEMIWAFKTGGNLISASRERSIEEMYNTVKLINRETGKTATKVNAKNKALYGNTQYYEEISNKDKNLSKMAKQKLKSLSKITSTMSMSGLNSDGAMGQFFVGDPIYVEEKNTGMVSGYWVRNVSHTFLADDAIQLDFDLTATEDIPEIQYDNSKK